MQNSSYTLLFVVLFLLSCLSNAKVQDFTSDGSECGSKEKASILLDTVGEFMKKAKELYPSCSEEGSCGKREKSLAYLEVASKLTYEVKEIFPKCPECPKHHQKPMDCSEILLRGYKESGVYTIWPRNRISSGKSLDVYCDMQTDGGGWTVIQRRGNFSTPKDYFYKDWKSYKEGFGNLKEEFWIGNDNIFALSNQANNTIRFDLQNIAGNTAYAEYNTFWIEDEQFGYILHIKGYSGNAGDSMDFHNNNKFSTKDRKNDKTSVTPCAIDSQGAWWYKDCSSSNLNGLYQPGIDSRKGIIWGRWTRSICLAGVEIKLRPHK